MGDRLARLALTQTYGKDIPSHGPEPTKVSAQKNTLTVRFSHAQGLKTTDSKPPSAFELAGKDGVFHPAAAKIHGDAISLTSAKVQQPVAVRYAWANDPKVNLINGAGLPTPPFHRKLK